MTGIGRLEKGKIDEMFKKIIEIASSKDVLEKYLYISLKHKDRCDDEITRPNKYLEDINDVMSLELSTSDGFLGRLSMKKVLLQMAGMSVEEAWEIARANTINKEAINPYADELLEAAEVVEDDLQSIKEIKKIVKEVCGNMTVITSKSKYDGAGAIYATEKLKQFANGSRLLIIPSSIHELIAMRYEVGMDIVELNKIIRNTNKTGYENNEVLSDRAYVIDF